MNKNYIELKDVDLEKLRLTTFELLGSMEVSKCLIYKHNSDNEFILTFPNGISNEMFIFFFCALMAPDLTNSNNLLGWFFANDDITIYEQTGDFDSFKRTTYSKRIMMTPEGDEKGNLHQYGISENGKEIHFGMDGSFKVQERTKLVYINPISNLKDYNEVELIEKPFEEVKQPKTIIEKLKLFIGK